MKLIFEKNISGQSAVSLPESDVGKIKIDQLLPKSIIRKKLDLPSVNKTDLVRHYTKLSQRNFGVDQGFYPLGSCTMKYSPKVNEDMASLAGFTQIHPLAHDGDVQGALQLYYELEQYLKEITGFIAVSLQPAAGAHGEATGVMLMKAYFEDRKEKRTKILIPDAAHGTNPASCTLSGFETVTIKSNNEGEVDLDDLKANMDKETVGLMLTNPNTLGLFEQKIKQICQIVHRQGGLVYCDGANMNSMLGITRPADQGFDLIQLNLHKSFSTPHGGGGPGSGPVGVNKKLAPYLPVPQVKKKNHKYYRDYNYKKSIGKVKAFMGNFGVMVKAYTYIRALGPKGLKRVGQHSVLNANYLMTKLKPYFDLAYNKICMHECVFSDKNQQKYGVTTLDIAKRLLDYGYHAPTIYFPMIVHGAIMIEPTETESKRTLDEFVEVMIKIADECKTKPELVKKAPHNMPVTRLDEVTAARSPNLKWEE
ncbi:MAG: aminomethyl-transferring glycine dehydrogenase subunit GcvPB [Patescibacteria group bacterium]